MMGGMRQDKIDMVLQILKEHKGDVLQGRNSRHQLGLDIANRLNMVRGHVISWLDELQGLNLNKADERQFFIDMLFYL